MQFHERIKEYRKREGLTQEELAQEIHVSRSAVAKWENGLGLPSDDSLDAIAAFFKVNREELLADRETEAIIVAKNGKLSRQKLWLIVFIALACALLIVSTVLGVFLTREEKAPAGSGESVVTGIYARFNTEYKTLKGDENIRVYRLKTGETYEFYVNVSHRGSKDIRLGKGGVEVYYNTQLLAFDEGKYWDDDSEATPTDEFPFYFTCYDTLGYTEIFVVANGYWCKVAVIIEN